MALTWRDVAAPDFRSSMEGYKAFSDSLNQAFASANRGLNQYDASLDENANRQIMMEIAAAKDADAVRNLTAGFATRPGGDRISANTLNMALARPGQMLRESADQLALDSGKWDFARRVDIAGRQDAAAPAMLGYYDASRFGKGADYTKSHPELTRLPFADISALGAAGINAENTGVQIDSGRQEYKQKGITFDQAQQDRELGLQATELADKIILQAGNTDEATRLVNSLNVDARVRDAVRAKLAGAGLPAGPGPGSLIDGLGDYTGGGGGPDPLRVITRGGTGNLGIPALPDSVQTLGQASEFARGLTARGQESSAMGLYQIVGQTLRGKNNQGGYGEKALGKNWKELPWNFENQDKIAEKIFNDHRGSASALKGQWASLSLETAEKIRKMPWAEARQYIARGESSGNPARIANAIKSAANMGNQATAVNDALRVETMNLNSNSPLAGYAKLSGDGRSPADVAAALTSDPAFKGLSTGYIQSKIEETLTAAAKEPKLAGKMNAAIAAHMLRFSLKATDGSIIQSYIPGVRQWNGVTLGGMFVDKTKLSERITEYAKGGGSDNQATQESLARETANIGAARKLAEQAQAAYSQARYQNSLGKSVDTEAPLKRLEAAQAYLQSLEGVVLGRKEKRDAEGKAEAASASKAKEHPFLAAAKENARAIAAKRAAEEKAASDRAAAVIRARVAAAKGVTAPSGPGLAGFRPTERPLSDWLPR